MRDLYLTIENGDVIIRDLDEDEILYRIRKEELPLTRSGSDSEWIMQLLPKTWINIEILYKVAQHIQREFPDNKINWRDTFFVVEKSKYLDSLGDILTEKSDSVAKDVKTKIDFGQKETNEETHKIIEEIVNRRLKEFGL